MADGTALFHANHKNLAASGAAITAASLGAARTAMRTQKDASGNATLNIRPNLLIVPAALEDTARVLMASETDPSQSNSRKPNPVRGAFNVIVDARLDAASTTAWYLAANPSVFDVKPWMEQMTEGKCTLHSAAPDDVRGLDRSGS